MKSFVFGLMTVFVTVIHAVPCKHIADDITSISRHHDDMSNHDPKEIPIEIIRYMGDYKYEDANYQLTEITKKAVHQGLKRPWFISYYLTTEMEKLHPDATIVVLTSEKDSDCMGVRTFGNMEWFVELRFDGKVVCALGKLEF